MDTYQKAIEVMKTLFSKDYQFGLATATDQMPSLRFVDTYFDGTCFYVVTYGLSRKVKEIATNPNVALATNRMYSFTGKAYNIGHPLLPENQEIREKLIQVFEPWYFLHNNEDDSNMCYLKIIPTSGFFYKDGTGYRVDFEKETAEEVPFTFDIVLTDD